MVNFILGYTFFEKHIIARAKLVPVPNRALKFKMPKTPILMGHYYHSSDNFFATVEKKKSLGLTLAYLGFKVNQGLYNYNGTILMLSFLMWCLY